MRTEFCKSLHISLVGAIVRIGNVLSCLIHSYHNIRPIEDPFIQIATLSARHVEQILLSPFEHAFQKNAIFDILVVEVLETLHKIHVLFRSLALIVFFRDIGLTGVDKCLHF